MWSLIPLSYLFDYFVGASITRTDSWHRCCKHGLNFTLYLIYFVNQIKLYPRTCVENATNWTTSDPISPLFRCSTPIGSIFLYYYKYCCLTKYLWQHLNDMLVFDSVFLHIYSKTKRYGNWFDLNFTFVFRLLPQTVICPQTGGKIRMPRLCADSWAWLEAEPSLLHGLGRELAPSCWTRWNAMETKWHSSVVPTQTGVSMIVHTLKMLVSFAVR